MAEYENYLNQIAPQYLQTTNGLTYLKAFANEGEELIEDARQARKEAMIQECSFDSVGYHFQNTYTLQSPFENTIQEKAYLRGLFTNIWMKNGSPEHLLDELKRFGFPNAKIWTWSDLIEAGIPSAFGGNWTKIVGMDVNGGMWYLPSSEDPENGGLNWTIQHQALGPNRSLSIKVDIAAKQIDVFLRTDGGGNPISTALDVFRALDDHPLAKTYIFFLFTGTGLGNAVISSKIMMPFCYYTYYIIDLYGSPFITSFVEWNQDGIAWNDGVTFWDSLVTFGPVGFAANLREVIRRATPSTMSCRFLRVYGPMGGAPTTVPIADKWEEDANGSIVDFYTTSY